MKENRKHMGSLNRNPKSIARLVSAERQPKPHTSRKPKSDLERQVGEVEAALEYWKQKMKPASKTKLSWREMIWEGDDPPCRQCWGLELWIWKQAGEQYQELIAPPL
jgi:hypothetical protein